MTVKDPYPEKSFNPWHFIWITVVMSELFTALMNTIQHHFSPEVDLWYLLKVGALDSLFVPLIVAPVIIYFLRSASALKKTNARLEHEIAERKEATKALRESEERYHALFNQSPDGILLIDLDGNLSEFNEKAYRQLGYTREEFRKLSISDIDAIESSDDVRDRMRGIVAAGHSEFETLHKTKDGTIRNIQVSTHTIDLSGRTLMHAIWRDITERKHAEQEREKLINDLQKALAVIKTLQGILPICSVCKKIRDNKGSWNKVEDYLSEHTDAEFSHGCCPECEKKALEEANKFIKENKP